MATTISIPRFLLPQRGLIWRRIPASHTTPGPVLIRFASSSTSKTSAKAAKKPLVLEKPERFNPPSHGARLPKKGGIPKHYGGTLSEAEFAKQQAAHYPGMMAPEGTFEHKFWHKPWIHTVIALSALGALAFWTFAENFKAHSPYYESCPSWSDLFYHPITSTRKLIEIVQLNSAYEAAIVAEKRQRKIDDVAKRLAYRRAHGLPDEVGLWPDHPWAKNEPGNPMKKPGDDNSPVAAADPTEDGGSPAGTAR
ncbi:hypothetical protein QBC37DRAFT_424101 [Rhypophila decipiens]|uniref:Uncharacterized protein n=1 Tax=Rhypophila decipiens TaxID=261697 RepID=A0AAN6Y555_9PEZI|nr:hypothetical protein QBC37DRAFT_424101 [Rhypophila decipiens]